jgi:hypothetical protein
MYLQCYGMDMFCHVMRCSCRPITDPQKTISGPACTEEAVPEERFMHSLRPTIDEPGPRKHQDMAHGTCSSIVVLTHTHYCRLAHTGTCFEVRQRCIHCHIMVLQGFCLCHNHVRNMHEQTCRWVRGRKKNTKN